MKMFLILTAILVTMTVPFLTVLSAAPHPDWPMLVIVAPWTDVDQVISAAGGTRVGPLSAPFASLAQSDNPKFISNAQTLGAWAVRDASRLSQMCGTL